MYQALFQSFTSIATFKLLNSPIRKVDDGSYFYIWENQSLERLAIPLLPEKVNGRSRIWTQEVWLWGLSIVNTLFYKSISLLNLSFRSQNILNQQILLFQVLLQTEIFFIILAAHIPTCN